jgi:formate C-acetyltransferase
MADSWTRAGNDVWTATALICDHNHDQGLRVNDNLAAVRKKQFPQHVAFIDALVADLRPRLPRFAGYTHTNPDMRRVVDEGFLSIEAELDAQVARTRAEGPQADADALNLLLALQDYAAGARAFHQRTREALVEAAARASGPRRAQLETVSAAFGRAFLHPADSFLEGLLAVNFAWMLDGCDSIGRLDQVLGPLFERDAASGRLDLALARRLLDELWDSFERLNGWNLQLGGYTPDGRDGCNALTLECLAACGRNRFRRPNVAFRITRRTPDSAVEEALRALAQGSGRPALYNDDAYVETLRQLDLGLTEEDAREIGFGGCTETMIAGLSNVGSLEGEINLAKALELALHDGFDPVARMQAGPHTGPLAEFASFEAFVAAVKRQIQFVTDAFVARTNGELRRRFGEGDPKLARTLFTRDCVARRKSFEAGGARYNWSVVSYQGIANLIDGLAAVRRCVFEERSVAADELVAALAANFEGREPLRQRLLAAPKFGNDDPAVDELGREIVEFAWRTLYEHQPPRGGRYLASCILFTTYGWAGKPVGALPDGRKAGEPLVDSAGPVAGRDTRGPTAMLRSVARLPQRLAIGTPVLNVRFLRRAFEEPASRRALVSMIRGYFAQGGLQIQLSVVSREDMLDAQRHPERHQNLLVRIGGFSEYFVKLDAGLQATVLARTEHGV